VCARVRVRARACVRAGCPCGVRRRFTHVSTTLIAITLLPVAQESSEKVHKLMQEVCKERKVECVCVVLFKDAGDDENRCH